MRSLFAFITLERAAKSSFHLGEGSMTALPIVTSWNQAKFGQFCDNGTKQQEVSNLAKMQMLFQRLLLNMTVKVSFIYLFNDLILLYWCLLG